MDVTVRVLRWSKRIRHSMCVRVYLCNDASKGLSGLLKNTRLGASFALFSICITLAALLRGATRTLPRPAQGLLQANNTRYPTRQGALGIKKR